MARTEHLAQRLKGFAIEQLRLAVAALGVVERGQVVEALKRVRMARPEHLARRLQRFSKEWLRLRVEALQATREVQRLQRFSKEWLRLRVVPLNRIEKS